jgi:AcrR family transcriptional regulator
MRSFGRIWQTTLRARRRRERASRTSGPKLGHRGGQSGRRAESRRRSHRSAVLNERIHDDVRLCRGDDQCGAARLRHRRRPVDVSVTRKEQGAVVVVRDLGSGIVTSGRRRRGLRISIIATLTDQYAVKSVSGVGTQLRWRSGPAWSLPASRESRFDLVPCLRQHRRPILSHQRGNRTWRSVVTVRFASGAVEYWYEAAVPVGDRVGREASGFVTSVELDGEDHATVSVGTPAPDFVRWDDLASSSGRTSPKRPTAPRIRSGLRALRSAAAGSRYRGGARRAGVARSTLYRHFRSKEDLVLAFLQRREQLWTGARRGGEASRRDSPRAAPGDLRRLRRVVPSRRLRGCSFINVLLESATSTIPVGGASAAHLEYIRSVVGRIAGRPGSPTRTSADSWHPHEGLDRRRRQGDVLAARRARAMGERSTSTCRRRQAERPRTRIDRALRTSRRKNAAVGLALSLPACVPEPAE